MSGILEFLGETTDEILGMVSMLEVVRQGRRGVPPLASGKKQQDAVSILRRRKCLSLLCPSLVSINQRVFPFVNRRSNPDWFRGISVWRWVFLWILILSGFSASAQAVTGSVVLVGQVNGLKGSAAINGSYAYVGDGTNGLRVVDVSDPHAPAIVGTLDTDGEAYGLTVVGNLVYLADKNSGIKIINVSNPAQPTLAGQFIQQITGDERWAFDVDVQGNFAYISYDFLGGLIVDISNPANPQMVRWVGTPSWSREFFPQGTIAYHAHAAAG